MEKTKLLRLREVESIVGLKKSAIYSWMKKGKFPAPVRMGTKSVAWKLDDLETWMDNLPKWSAEGVD